MNEKKVVYTITIRTSNDGIRAAAVVRNIQYEDGTVDSTLTTAFAQEDLDDLIKVLDGKAFLNLRGEGVLQNDYSGC